MNSATRHISSSPAPSTAHNSPRSRRNSRPLPFTMALPSPASFPGPNTEMMHSRPQSPSFWRSTVVEVHSVLYGGRGKDREEICELVKETYEGGATFENPVTFAKGQQQIADVFCLLGIVPGTMWSELGEICESPSYDGGRLVVMSHTLHISFLPFLDPHAAPFSSTLHPSHPFYTSTPSTPFPQNSPGGSVFSLNYPALSASKWPIGVLFSALNPRTILSSLTTLHLRLHTRLVINEQGKITAHEDMYSLKDIVESLPLVGHIYALNRSGLGAIASLASRTLFRKSREVHLEEEGREPLLSGTGVATSKNPFGCGSPMRTRKSSMVGPVQGLGTTRSTGLGLEGDLQLRFAGEERREGELSTTMDADSN